MVDSKKVEKWIACPRCDAPGELVEWHLYASGAVRVKCESCGCGGCYDLSQSVRVA
jgi:hypothetical protein